MKKKLKKLTPQEQVAHEKLRIEGLAMNMEKRFIDVQKLEVALENAKKDVGAYQQEIRDANANIKKITG